LAADASSGGIRVLGERSELKRWLPIHAREQRNMRLTLALWAALLALAWGCSLDEQPHRAPLTKRQRDSTIAATTVLPGSRVVARALQVADSASARARRIDATAR
jgi:hypothetical protein